MNSIVIVLPILTLLMFDLGLTLAPKDFAIFLKNPKPLWIGLIGQLIVLPLMAFLVASIYDLSPLFTVGLVLIACCPGGSSSNIFSMLARGDVPLSVSLTAISSIVTLFTIPIILGFGVQLAGQEGMAINLPVGNLLIQNLLLMLLPIIVGMAIRRYASTTASKIEHLLTKCAFPLLLVLITIYFIENRVAIIDNIGVLGVSVTTLLVLSMAAGATLAWIARLNTQQQRTIVIEVGMQNAAQAIAIAASPFILADSRFAIPAIIYALMMNVVLLGYVLVARSSQRSRVESRG